MDNRGVSSSSYFLCAEDGRQDLNNGGISLDFIAEKLYAGNEAFRRRLDGGAKIKSVSRMFNSYF